MSLILVDELKEHTPGAGILIGSAAAIGATAPSTSQPFVIDLQGSGGAVQRPIIVFKGDASGTTVIEALGLFVSTTDQSFTIGGLFGLHIGQPLLGTGAHATNIIGVFIDGMAAAADSGSYGLFVTGMNSTSPVNAGLNIGGVNGATANNYGILVGDVTGTGAFAIKTGLGLVQFGDTSSVVLGTIATNKLIRDDSVTWDASGVLFTGWRLSVTPTAYAANSRLISVAAGGVEAFYVGWSATNVLYTELAGISGMTGARVSSGPFIVASNAIWIGTFGGGGAAFGILGTGGLSQSNNVDQYGVKVLATPNSSSPPTTSYAALYGQVISPAVSFTMASGYGIYVPDASKGAGSTITTLYGLYIADQTQGGTNYAIYTNAGIVRVGDLLLTVASVAGGAKFRLPHGTAPSSPVDGDVWTTTAGIFVRVNGTTVGPLT